MTYIVSEDEGEPTGRPDPGMFDGVEAGAVWERIESYITHRWGVREVVWVAEGRGVFVPRLKPATITTTEVWRDGGWQEVTLTPTPRGLELDGLTYRIVADVGSGAALPWAVVEAWQRLGAFMSQAKSDPLVGHSGATDGDFSFQRPAAWAARAMQLSGAADMLRGYR